MRNDICNMDALDWLQSPYHHCLPYRMLFADPPDGIGLKYNGFKDKIPPAKYERMLYAILTEGARLFDFMWLSVNPIWAAMIGHVTYEWQKMFPKWKWKHCVQTFTFGQHNKHDFGNNHRLMYRYQRPGTRRYMDAVKVPSWRQLNGDKRAASGGRVPGDVMHFERLPDKDWNWVLKNLRGDDDLCALEPALTGISDVFDFPRVTGNSKQRRSFSPTQLHEGLYERCIRSCCKAGDTVVDLFAGSGTLGRVAPRCKVNGLMVEVSEATYKAILKDQPELEEVYYE